MSLKCILSTFIHKKCVSLSLSLNVLVIKCNFNDKISGYGHFTPYYLTRSLYFVLDVAAVF